MVRNDYISNGMTTVELCVLKVLSTAIKGINDADDPYSLKRKGILNDVLGRLYHCGIISSLVHDNINLNNINRFIVHAERLEAEANEEIREGSKQLIDGSTLMTFKDKAGRISFTLLDAQEELEALFYAFSDNVAYTLIIDQGTAVEGFDLINSELFEVITLISAYLNKDS